MNTLANQFIDSNVREHFPISNYSLAVHNGKLVEMKFPGQSSVMESGKEEHLSKRQKTTLHIKNMVSLRCKLVLKAVLERLELYFSDLEIGRVEIIGDFSHKKRNALKDELPKYGLELLENERAILVEKIKNVIIEMIHYENELPNVKFSVYLCEKLNNEYSYGYLANLFSEVKGMTIRHYIMTHRIERAKEMIVYNNDLTLSEIAWHLNFSSVAHLSNQFKQITGFTVSHFRKMKQKRLTALEDL